ncbi:HAD-IC family P-type ATPase [Candidatus Parcubacteria bacterium]|nr:HAD-IC family P-type ATPase [Candidatus Parcubacteria bacterium]
MSNFHNISIKSCLNQLKTSESGLTNSEAKKRSAKYGLNALPAKKPLGKIVILLSQFKSPLIYILLLAGVITLFFKDYVDSGVIFGAVILNTIIGFFQENKANNALNKLKLLIRHKAIVLRDGNKIEIESAELVVGDIIILQAGNRVLADARIIEANNLTINEAALTGESLPVEKNSTAARKGAIIADRKNMVYSGTIITKGQGKAVVCAIGVKTEIGKIAELVSDTEDEKTPLQLRLAKFSKIIGILTAIVSLLIFIVGILQGRGVFEMFKVSIAIAVAAIPEGLIVAVTVILTIGMQRILKQKALTRKLVAAETLGSTTIICSDKTGTLTEGKMHVAHIIIGEKEFELNDLGARQKHKEAKAASMALQTGMMCNDAVIENYDNELKEWKIIGAPTESALLSAAIQSGLNKKELLKIEPKIDELPFESDNKFMISLHKKSGGYIIYEKGAPEKLLKKSTNFYHKGEIIKLTKQELKKLNRVYEKFTNKGLRVIAVASREIKKIPGAKKTDWSALDKNLTFIGFIALKDPLRPEAKETIKMCLSAGIRPIIITGDHKLTAKAIGAEIGFKTESKNIITGEELDKISDSKFKKIVKKIDIYARVNPRHKLRIVKMLQDRGEVVAMTGDGINDSPALKAADIGIALGNGTDIAKESSDIVLMDNNFKTIISAVRQGRIIFSNIRKVITYLISDCFSEIILIVGSMLFGLPLAILPAQILWINIVNDGLPDFSLAFEKGNKHIMSVKPIKKNEHIFNSEMKAVIFGAGAIKDLMIFALFFWMYQAGSEIGYLRTLFFTILGFKSLLSIFSLRNLSQPIWKINPFGNLYLVGAVAISFTLLLSAIYLPFLQTLLSTTVLNLNDWAIIISIGALSVFMIETTKYYFIARKKV